MELSIFKVKNLGKIWPNLFSRKTNPLIENWSFYKKFNPKYIATSSSNLLTRPRASSESIDFFSFGFALHKHPRLWLWDPTQKFSNTKSPVCDFKTTLESLNH